MKRKRDITQIRQKSMRGQAFVIIFALFLNACATTKLPVTVKGDMGPSDDATLAIAELVIRNKFIGTKFIGKDKICFLAINDGDPPEALFDRLTDLSERFVPISEWKNIRKNAGPTSGHWEYNGEIMPCLDMYPYYIWIRDWISGEKVNIEISRGGAGKYSATAYWSEGTWSMSKPKAEFKYIIME